MKRFRETSTRSLPDTMSPTLEEKTEKVLRDVCDFSVDQQCKIRGPKQENKEKSDKKSSEWTKIRLSLEFIRKSKELIDSKKPLDNSRDELSRSFESFTFLGQVYADEDLETEGIQRFCTSES